MIHLMRFKFALVLSMLSGLSEPVLTDKPSWDDPAPVKATLPR